MVKLSSSKMPHNQDGPWSTLVCFSAMMSWTAAVGFVFSFGIFFPVFMDYFNEDRERTGMNEWSIFKTYTFRVITHPLRPRES